MGRTLSSSPRPGADSDDDKKKKQTEEASASDKQLQRHLRRVARSLLVYPRNLLLFLIISFWMPLCTSFLYFTKSGVLFRRGQLLLRQSASASRRFLHPSLSSDCEIQRQTTFRKYPILSARSFCTVLKSMSSFDDDAPEKTPPAWTVCPKCHGQGKVSLPLTRKQKKKRARLMEEKGEDDEGNSVQPNCRWEPCKRCEKSGLILTATDRQDDGDQLCSTRTVNSPPLHVAIIGGGIGGLALCIALQHRNFQVTVYERDAAFDERSQGYGLTLQQAAPQLRALGITTELGNAGRTSTKHIVHDSQGTIVGEWGLRQWGRGSKNKQNKSPKRQNVHIARQALRRVLLEAIPDPSAIQWGHKLTSISHCSDASAGKVKLELEDSIQNCTKTVEADIVVGADGIRSQVRSQMIGDHATPLRYLKCIVILGIFPLNDLPDSVRQQVNANGDNLFDGETVFQTADGSTRIYSMPFSESEYMWQLSFPLEEQEAIDTSQQGPTALKALALEQCSSWHSPVPELLQATNATSITGYPVYDRQLLTAKQLRDNLPPIMTLMADACHPMSPFKGQGANQALLDAISLARFLCSSQLPQSQNGHQNGTKKEKNEGMPEVDDKKHTIDRIQNISAAIANYEREMLERSAPKVNASAEAANFLHSGVAIQAGNVTRGGAAKQAGMNNE